MSEDKDQDQAEAAEETQTMPLGLPKGFNPKAQALAESNWAMHLAQQSIDIDRRKSWFFVAEETLVEWVEGLGDKAPDATLSMEALARRRAGVPAETPVRRGVNMTGRVMYAVWTGPTAEPTFDPEF
jgi:hypothetical protein